MSERHESGDGLPADLRELLAAERTSAELPLAVRQRLWTRLEQSTFGLPPSNSGPDGSDPQSGSDGGDSPPGDLAQGPPAAPASTAASASATATVGAGRAGLVASLTKPLVLAAFVAGTVTGATSVVLLRGTGDPAPRASGPAATTRSVDAPPNSRQSAAPLARATPAAPVAAAPRPSDNASHAGPPQPNAAPRVQLQRTPPRPARAATATAERARRAEERLLLEMARNALARGRPQDALQALSQHQAQFPTSSLAEEREGLRVIAVVHAGDRTQAQELYREFAAHHPDSLLLPAIRAALAPPLPAK